MLRLFHLSESMKCRLLTYMPILPQDTYVSFKQRSRRFIGKGSLGIMRKPYG